MADHDPLCIWFPGHSPKSGCIGPIARVRADERDRVHATIQAGEIPASLYEEMVYDLRERIAQEIEADEREFDTASWVAARARYAAIARGTQ